MFDCLICPLLTLILLTNSKTYNIPDLKGYSKKEVTYVCDMLGINCSFKIR